MDEQKKTFRELKDEIAVALQYDAKEDAAPKVVAKGRGYIAEQIIKIAEENGIMIHKDADLAEVLNAIDIDAEIPVEAFTAVAEIIAYMYKLNQNMAEGVNAEERAKK